MNSLLLHATASEPRNESSYGCWLHSEMTFIQQYGCYMQNEESPDPGNVKKIIMNYDPGNVKKK